MAALIIPLLIAGQLMVSRAALAYGVATAAPKSQSKSALSDRALDNLVAYTRLLGYIRYFHPSDGATAADWDSFAVHTMHTVENVSTPQALAAALQRLFAPYAPTLRVFVTGQAPPPLPAALNLPADTRGIDVVQWRYIGFVEQPPALQHVSRERHALNGTAIPSGFHDPRQPYLADLGGGVSALIPLALFADAKGTLPHVTIPKQKAVAEDPNDPHVWLVDTAIVWNALQHFYPYWDTLTVDWHAALRTALATVAQAPDHETFYRALRTLLALLNDGHVYTAQPFGRDTSWVPPVQWDWIENRLIVVHVTPHEAGRIRVGDEVLRVDGRPVSAILSDPANATGGTTAFRQFVALQDLRFGAADSPITLQVRHPDGATFTVTLHRLDQFNPYNLLLEPRPKHAVAMLGPGIVYLDWTRLTDHAFQKAVPMLARAKGIVIDARGYPRGPDPGQPFNAVWYLFGHLSTSPLQSTTWQIPDVTYPDHQNMAFQDSSSALSALHPHFKARLVFLIDANDAVSQAETYLEIAEAYHLGALVGSHTAGTNGNIAELSLPGGYAVTWTGMRVLKHNGSPLMHVGVLPTVPVDRTVAGVVAGHDEVLDRGLQVLDQEIASGQ
jgi:hypothetical protein